MFNFLIFKIDCIIKNFVRMKEHTMSHRISANLILFEIRQFLTHSLLTRSYAYVRTTSRDEMKFAQMYHAEAFPEIFQVSAATMAIVVAMYTPRLFDRVRNVPLS